MFNYNSTIQQHFDHPENVGEFDPSLPMIYSVTHGSIDSGIMVKLSIKIKPQNGLPVIEEMKFLAYGCVVVIASCSWLTHCLKDKTLLEASELTAQTLQEHLGISTLKQHCAIMIIDALQKLIKEATMNLQAPQAYDPNALTMTDAAIKQVKKSMAKLQQQGQTATGLRINVKRYGCSGFGYDVQIVDQACEGDHVYSADDVAIYVAADAFAKVKGTRIDFVREGLNETFKFINPNEKGSCGCGESFNVDES